MALLNRMLRAAKLEVSLYEEVEADQAATGQAALVVILGALAMGLGSVGEAGWLGLILGVVVGFIGWAIWAWLNYFLGARVFPEPQTGANWGQLARSMGFAYTPRLIAVLGLLPSPQLRAIVSLVAAVWSWIAMVIGVRQALDYKSTWRAIGVTFLGFIINVILIAIINTILLGIARAS